jgi:hypothetical protein
MIARHLHPYFWDVDLQIFEPQSYPEYTIGRILEYGDEAAVSWLKQNFTQDQIVAVIRNDRKLSRRSAGFWALVYAVPPGETTALKADRP